MEHANGDNKDMLATWLSDNNSKDWSTGIMFAQFHKNSAHHSGIKCSPYSVMFGSEARIGLTSSSHPIELMSTTESEADLFAILDDKSGVEDVTMQSSYDTDRNDSRTVQITQRRHEASIAKKEKIIIKLKNIINK